MELILAGQAKSLMVLNINGTYLFKGDLVNSYPYWVQENGGNAIWFRDGYRRWYLGPKEYIGGYHSDISLMGPRGIDKAPTRIILGWSYLENGTRISAATSEIVFKDLSPGMHFFFKAVIHYKTKSSSF